METSTTRTREITAASRTPMRQRANTAARLASPSFIPGAAAEAGTMASSQESTIARAIRSAYRAIRLLMAVSSLGRGVKG